MLYVLVSTYQHKDRTQQVIRVNKVVQETCVVNQSEQSTSARTVRGDSVGSKYQCYERTQQRINFNIPVQGSCAAAHSIQCDGTKVGAADN